MEEFIYNYITHSKKCLPEVIYSLEENIVYKENNIWTSKEELANILENIINIYYDRYFLYSDNNFSKIDKYIKFNNKINRKLKCILLSIIDYYESINNTKVIKESEGSILYLTILIYLAIIIYNIDFKKIDTPKKIEKVINNVIDNFQKIKFSNNKNLDLLIESLRPIIEDENKIKRTLSLINNSDSFNYYISVDNLKKYYKVMYQYDIKELNQFDRRDTNIAIDKLNIKDEFNKISFDLCCLTLFKTLKMGLDYYMLFPLDINNINKKEDTEIQRHIKYIVDYKDINGNYDLINKCKDNNIDLFIEINDVFESDNYNMFMGIKNVLVPEEFLSMNEKYIEIWKDMNINFIVKDFLNKMLEIELLNR